MIEGANEMSESYLLDTNAYFNFLKYATVTSHTDKTDETNAFAEVIEIIKKGKNHISALSQIEIISVIGKYARGNSGGIQKCNCVVSETGERCSNNRYTNNRKRWNRQKIKWWLKLVNETIQQASPVLSVSVLPLTGKEVIEAQKIVLHALTQNFGSLDALIAATAKEFGKNDGADKLTIITSDKGLKACLDRCALPYWDAFKAN